MASPAMRPGPEGPRYYLRFRDKAGAHMKRLDVSTWAEAVAAAQAKTRELAKPPPTPATRALEAFKKHWRAVRRVDESTLGYYDELLRPLFAFLLERGPMERWQPSAFDEYVATKTHWSANTIRKLATAMRTFAKWARRAGIECPDVARDFSGPRATLPVKEAYSLDELRRLLEALDGRAIRAAVLFASWAGLSAGDLERLRPEHLKDGWLTRPRSKTGRPLVIPLAAPLRSLVASMKAEDWPILPASASARWRTTCRAAGIPSKGGLKRLRHTFATLLEVAGVDDTTVRALMGHLPRSMTDRYRHADRERLKAAIAALEAIVLGVRPKAARRGRVVQLVARSA